MSSKPKVTAVACSILKREIEYMRSTGIFSFEVEYIDSSLHMSPMSLSDKMKETVDRLLSSGARVLLIYGDCHPFMIDITAQAPVVRTKACSCVELLLGKTEYKKLMKEDAFVLLPEWVVRRRQILMNIPGYKKTDSQNLTKGFHKKLVFLDTGIYPVSQEDIQECSDIFGLSCETKTISLDVFRDTIYRALNELIHESN